MLLVSVQEIALVRPTASNLSLRLVPWPQPASIDMAVADTADNSLLVTVVYFSRINLVAQVSLCNRSALLEAGVGAFARDETIHDLIAHLQSFMLLPAVFGKLSSW